MKKLFLLFFFFPFFLFSQQSDSLVGQRIKQLFETAASLEALGQFQEMLDSVRLASTIGLEYFGPQSEEYAHCLQSLGGAHTNLGNFAVADSLLLQAQQIIVEKFGKESPQYAENLYHLSTLYYFTKDTKNGIDLTQEAVDLHEKLYGKIHIGYAICTSYLGNLYMINNQYDLSEFWLLESQNVIIQLSGKESDDYASTLHYLSFLYKRMGRYEKAEPLLLEMININEKIFGRQHPTFAINLDNLASFYFLIGKYDQSILYFKEALTIIEKTTGKSYHMYGPLLNNFALVYLELGHFEKTESLYLEALRLMEGANSQETLNYATTSFNLAITYSNMGRHEAAEKLFLKSLSIHKRVMGEEDWKYPQLQVGLATVYYNTNRYREAESLYLSALNIQKKTLGTSHPDYALSLVNLGNLYVKMERFEEAEFLFLQAQGIYQKDVNQKGLRYASLLGSLAQERGRAGQFEEARDLLFEAKGIQKKIIGNQDISIAQTLEQLAQLNIAMQKEEEAIPYFIAYNRINQSLQLQRANHFSNTELADYQRLFQQANHFLSSFHHIHSSDSILQISYNNALFQKGFLLENTIRRERLVAEAPEVLQEKHSQWKGYLRRLIKEYSKAISERNEDILNLEKKTNSLEKDLTQSIAGFGDTRQFVDWKTVQSQLSPKSAAIEFIHYQYYNPLLTDSVLYAALLLRPGEEAPRFIPLFDERQLRQLLIQGSEAYDSLHQLIWQPLEKELEAVHTIYFSPTGLLHRLHLGAIAINKKETIADLFRLIQLGSTRQLASAERVVEHSNDAMLFGGINYEMDSTAIVDHTSENNTKPRKNPSFSRNAGPLGDSWKALTWTEVEVKSVGGILADNGISVHLRMGHDAKEEVFKNIGKGRASPRVLHLATHGYFFPAPTINPSDETTTAFKTSEHPMIRSGLILASANPVWEGQAAPAGREDGILTAYEISQMNLSNTELVVLSACDTGLGDIEGHEGVYGLQRAFKIAGAKYLIMSLWQVPDFQTQELMTLFYLEWLEEKKPIPEAFRAAQTQMRERYPDPFNWAGFILVE